MRGCASAAILLIALIAFLGAIAFYLLGRPPDLTAQFTPVPVSGTAAARLDAKIATAQVATAPLTIEIDEQEATSKLVATLADEPSAPRVDDLQVHFRDGKVYISGTYRDAPIPVNFVITGHLDVRDGQVIPTIDQIDTGHFPLPDSIKAQITDLTTDTTKLNSELTMRVTAIQVLDGRAVITGEPK